MMDRIALLAMILYIMGAISYYLPFFIGSGAYTGLAIQSFVLLPPVFAGAGVYAIVAHRKNLDFAPRWLAVAALGSGAATFLAWRLFMFGISQHNRALPAPDSSGPGLDPWFPFVIIPYGILCAVLSIVAALALPKLVRALIHSATKPDPVLDRSPGA